jgi:hypothetical protein
MREEDIIIEKIRSLFRERPRNEREAARDFSAGR